MDKLSPQHPAYQAQQQQQLLFQFGQIIQPQLDYMKENLEPQLDEIVEMMFEAYDIDNSKLLERWEIRRMIDDICKEFGMAVYTDEHLDHLIRMVDQNSDDRFSMEELGIIIRPILRKQLS